MAFNYVTLTLDLKDGSGNLITQGYVTCTPNAALVGPGLTSQAPVTATFRNFTTAQTVSLLATDNAGVTPAGWAWQIVFTDTPSNPAGFSFYLPFANGASQNLSSIASVPAVPPTSAYLPLPTGTAGSGQVPVATGSGSASAWGPVPDKYFTQVFTTTASVTVAHNLSKYPAVTVIDSALTQVIGDVIYTDVNNLTVNFSAPFSGTIVCN